MVKDKTAKLILPGDREYELPVITDNMEIGRASCRERV